MLYPVKQQRIVTNPSFCYYLILTMYRWRTIVKTTNGTNYVWRVKRRLGEGKEKNKKRQQMRLRKYIIQIIKTILLTIPRWTSLMNQGNGSRYGKAETQNTIRQQVGTEKLTLIVHERTQNLYKQLMQPSYKETTQTTKSILPQWTPLIIQGNGPRFIEARTQKKTIEKQNKINMYRTYRGKRLPI